MFEKIFAKRGLSLDRLRALVETVEAGTIAGAVDGDSVRAGQYSRQISELEEYFGFELAERRGRRLIFNEAGKELAQKGKEVLTLLEGFCGSGKDAEIRLTIGSYESLIHWLLIPRTSKIQRKIPQVRWVIRNDSTAGIIKGLKELTFDVGLVRKNAVERPLKCEPLLKMSYSVFAPRSVTKPNSDWRSVLCTVPFAVRQNDGEFWQACEHLAATHRIKLDVRLSCVSAVEACKAVSLGHYCSILPTIAATELDEAHFVHFDVPFGYERNICLAWNPRIISIRPAVERIINALKEELLTR
jgi:DNA-binding transcriptional LysR family regulator